jgi:hypothetical protein
MIVRIMEFGLSKDALAAFLGEAAETGFSAGPHGNPEMRDPRVGLGFDG